MSEKATLTGITRHVSGRVTTLTVGCQLDTLRISATAQTTMAVALMRIGATDQTTMAVDEKPNIHLSVTFDPSTELEPLCRMIDEHLEGLK